MKPAGIAKAIEHLGLARIAATRLDIANGFQEYERAWSEFLSQVSRLYSKLEQGSKGSNISEPWFGKKKHERRKDPLLSYLHHARDCDEHGLDHITKRAGSGWAIKGVQTRDNAEVTISFLVKKHPDGSVEMKDPSIQNIDGDIMTAVKVFDPYVELVRVRDNRFGDSFDPPKEHLGKPLIDVTPASVAKLAIDYLENLLQEASALPPSV